MSLVRLALNSNITCVFFTTEMCSWIVVVFRYKTLKSYNINWKDYPIPLPRTRALRKEDPDIVIERFRQSLANGERHASFDTLWPQREPKVNKTSVHGRYLTFIRKPGQKISPTLPQLSVTSFEQSTSMQFRQSLSVQINQADKSLNSITDDPEGQGFLFWVDFPKHRLGSVSSNFCDRCGSPQVWQLQYTLNLILKGFCSKVFSFRLNAKAEFRLCEKKPSAWLSDPF